jgi:hypothetical protein
MKLTTQLCWTSRLIETVTKTSENQGGKGGGGGPYSYTYTYAVDCMACVCQGPVGEVMRIWANQKILWQSPNALAEEQLDFDTAYYAELDYYVNEEYMTDIDEAYVSAFFFAQNNYAQEEYTYGTQAEALAYIMAHPGTVPNVSVAIAPPNSSDVNALLGQMLSPLGQDMQYAAYKVRMDAIDIYLGYEDQLPNALIESYLGVGNVPAYRGVCYFVLHNLQLEDFGNAIPTFTVEVVQNDGSDPRLSDVLNDVCTQAGLTSTQFDPYGYIPPTATMKGYAVTQSTSARDIITDLQKTFPFDAAESGYALVFQWINQSACLIMRREDFGAHIDTDQLPESELITRMHDLDLPRRLNFKFQEPARNYSTNTVFAFRAITQSQSIVNVESTIALDRPTAKSYVEEQLALRFTTRRSFKIILPFKYAILEPGDVVWVPFKDQPNEFYGLRVIDVAVGANTIVQVTFIDHNYHVETTATAGTDLSQSGDVNQSSISPPTSSPTYAYPLDIPLLTDTEADLPGYYGVLTGSQDGWVGGALIVNMGGGAEAAAFGTSLTATSGSNWYTVIKSNGRPSAGFCMTVLPVAQPGSWDYTSKVRVRLLDTNDTLYNAAPFDMLTQALNVAVIGNEIIQYANARNIGSGLWELSQFLRGLRGTEWAISQHAAADRFIQIAFTSTQRITHSQNFLNSPGSYKAVTMGDTNDSVTAFAFTDTGNSLRPYAPQIVGALREDTNDVLFKWLPRVRQNGNWVANWPLTLDQSVEAYEIDVIVGGVVMNTYYLGAVRTWTYTSAMQTADLGAPAEVQLNLFQIGATIGRGFVSEVTV